MNAHSSGGLARLLNAALRKAGVQLVRSSTLTRLSTADERLDALAARLAESEARQAALVQRLEAASGTGPAVAGLSQRLASLEGRLGEDTIGNLIRYAMKAHWRVVDLIEDATGAAAPSACPLCGHRAGPAGFEVRESRCIFQGGRLVRHVCPACDLIFGPQKMLALDDEMVDLDYRNLYRIYAEGDATDSTIRTFHLLGPRKEGTYLDFGCGGTWSSAIEQLRAQGWNVFGFEPSAERSSEHVFASWDEIAHRRFDGILSHNVLEHLFDPAGTTARLAGLLTPGGRIVHATPCFEYCYEYSHYHVFFFAGRSADMLARRAGMTIEGWVRDGNYIACTLRADASPSP